MTGVEDQLRDAYRSAARTVRPETIRPETMRIAAPTIPRPRLGSMFVPLAAAAAVVLAIALSVAVPRLLASSGGSATSTGTVSPLPPFQVIVTVTDGGRRSELRVERAATGRVVSWLAPPGRAQNWGVIAATGDATKFIVTAGAQSGACGSTRLYTLTLSARGSITGLVPLAVPDVPGEINTLAASSDGSTVAYAMDWCHDDTVLATVGVITGRSTRQWTGSNDQFFGPNHVTLSADGSTLGFTSAQMTGRGIDDTAWVLSTNSPPGNLSTAVRNVYSHTYTGGAGHPMTMLESALISPDGGKVYLLTNTTSASGKTVTMLIAKRTADGTSAGTIARWDGGLPDSLLPVSGRMLVWALGTFEPYGKPDYVAYLINPAARTPATVRMHGVPYAQWLALAW